MIDPDPPAPAGPVRGPSQARLLWALGFLALLFGAFAYRTLWGWEPASHDLPPLEGWIFLASDRPPQAVFALAAALAAFRWRSVAAACAAPGSPGLGPALALAAPFLFVGLLLLAAGRWHASPELTLVSAVTLGFGVATLVGGAALVRQVALPLLLLLFALPMPNSLYLPWVHTLEQVTTGFAVWALEMLGIPALREGETLTVPDDAFMVIETCSGAGSIGILTLLAAFWAGLTRAPWARGFLLVAAAPFVALGLNGLRVLTVILVPGSDAVGLHVLQGLVLFQGGVLGLWLIDRALARLLPGAPPPSGAPAPSSSGHPWQPAAWLATAALGCAAVVSLAAPVAPVAPTVVPWSMPLPFELFETSAQPQPVDHRFLGSLHFAWSQHAGYGPTGSRVDVFVASQDPNDARTSVFSTKNRFAGRAHDLVSAEEGPLGSTGLPGEEVIAIHDARRVVAWVLYAGIGPPWAEALCAGLGLRLDTPGTTRNARVMRLSTPAGSSRGDLDAARARLDATLSRLGPIFATD